MFFMLDLPPLADTKISVEYNRRGEKESMTGQEKRRTAGISEGIQGRSGSTGGKRRPQVRRSMSRKGNCRDNACAESFFKWLLLKLRF
jgi:hypothetical protein